MNRPCTLSHGSDFGLSRWVDFCRSDEASLLKSAQTLCAVLGKFDFGGNERCLSPSARTPRTAGSPVKQVNTDLAIVEVPQPPVYVPVQRGRGVFL